MRKRAVLPFLTVLLLAGLSWGCKGTDLPTEVPSEDRTAFSVAGTNVTTSTTGIPVTILGPGEAYAIAGPNLAAGFCFPPNGGSNYACMWDRGSEVPLSPTGFARDINMRGQVVGYVGSDAVLWYNGDLQTLESLARDWSYAFAINNRGDVAGLSYAEPGADGIRAVIWEKGEIRQLSPFYSEAQDINSRGQIIGYGRPYGSQVRALLWDNDETVVLNNLPGGDRAFGYALNDRGEAVGTCSHSSELFDFSACLWSGDQVLDLGKLDGGYNSSASDVNNRGQVVGYSRLNGFGPIHAVLWEDGKMVDLGTLGGNSSEARGITEDGRVVGYATSATGTVRVWAVVWKP